MNTSLYQGTPTVMVLDCRGLAIRELAYYRHPDKPQLTDEQITYHQFDACGALIQSIDSRLAERQKFDNTVKPNFAYLSSLSGKVQRTESVDAGTTVTLHDIAGRPSLAMTAAGTDTEVTRTWQYENARLPGRVLSISEQEKNKTARITERFIWAENTLAEKALNLAGQCVQHYEPAGLNQTDSIALTGIPLFVTRQLLSDEAEVNWQGHDPSVWRTLLAPEIYITQSTANAIGAILTTTDARGNVQRRVYDIAGLLKGSWLTLKGGLEQIIVKSLTYSAAGQKLCEEHGNGVVTTYTYEPETQRLTGIKTERPAEHVAGAKVLQDLRYTYDPVGNVLRITNDAQATRFWRNQKVVPDNTYTYDSLYQLVSATGREMAGMAAQGTKLPASIPLTSDNNAYTNYTRHYHYDRGGNLTQIRHSAPASNNSYTTNITVSEHSNRAVLSSLTEDMKKVDALFDNSGHQKQLQPGQGLVWTSRGELWKVTLVTRESGTNDSESYRYDASSQRVLKVSTQQTENNIQRQRVIYLPGLELRTTTNGSTETENLQVISVSEAGRAQVRVLNWETGKPEAINNNQMRYSYDNLIGSSCLEVDCCGNIISQEEYYPYGGTAVWMAHNQIEAEYKHVRYSSKERDATGLYYYGYRYYQPWVSRWLSADPAETLDGLNIFKMVQNNPINFKDEWGLVSHSSLEKKGERLGRIIGRRLRKSVIAQVKDENKEIKSVNIALKKRLKNARLPIHDRGLLKKAFEYALAGDKKNFARKYREANKAQDELMSTQTVYSIYKGMGSSKKRLTKTRKKLAWNMFNQLSLTRLPTALSGYNLGGDNVMQHPTSNKLAVFATSAKNHGTADITRRNRVIKMLKKSVHSNTSRVMAPIADANLKAATYTLAAFTAPVVANNIHPTRQLTQTDIDMMTKQRDAIKFLDNPRTFYLNIDEPWLRNPSARGFSPFREL